MGIVTGGASEAFATAPLELPWHSWATSASHGTVAAFNSAITASKIITLMAIDLFVDEDLLQRAKEDFQRTTKGEPYVSPVPKDQKVPLPN